MTEFHDLRELDTNTLRDIVTQSGVIWPEGGDRESRLFRSGATHRNRGFRRGQCCAGPG